MSAWQPARHHGQSAKPHFALNQLAKALPQPAGQSAKLHFIELGEGGAAAGGAVREAALRAEPGECGGATGGAVREPHFELNQLAKASPQPAGRAKPYFALHQLAKTAPQPARHHLQSANPYFSLNQLAKVWLSISVALQGVARWPPG